MALAGLLLSGSAVGNDQDQNTRPQSDPKLQKLYERRALAYRLLDRMMNGKTPCFTPACQIQKQKQINRIAQELGDIPRDFLKSRDRGLTSAYRFVKRPLLAPEDLNFFPERWEEWVYWWKKRYSAESQWKAEWTILVAEARALKDSTQTYLSWNQFTEAHQNLIREAIDRGLFEIAHFSKRSAELRQRLQDLSRPTRNLSSEEIAQRNRAIESVEAESQAVFEKLNSLNERFEHRTRAVVAELFPEDSFEDVMTTLHLLEGWMKLFGTTDLFSRSLKAHLTTRAHALQTLTQQIQDFNDLEYGALGINNFFSTLNPEISGEQELIIQEFLNEVDSTARTAYHLISFFLMNDAYQSLGILSTRAAYLLTSASNFALTWYDIDTSTWILPRSTRFDELRSQFQSTRVRMALKQEELLEKVQIVQDLIPKIEAEIINRGGTIE